MSPFQNIKLQLLSRAFLQSFYFEQDREYYIKIEELEEIILHCEQLSSDKTAGERLNFAAECCAKYAQCAIHAESDEESFAINPEQARNVETLNNHLAARTQKFSPRSVHKRLSFSQIDYLEHLRRALYVRGSLNKNEKREDSKLYRIIVGCDEPNKKTGEVDADLDGLEREISTFGNQESDEEEKAASVVGAPMQQPDIPSPLVPKLPLKGKARTPVQGQRPSNSRRSGDDFGL